VIFCKRITLPQANSMTGLGRGLWHTGQLKHHWQLCNGGCTWEWTNSSTRSSY